jgi:hypothetical protein
MNKTRSTPVQTTPSPAPMQPLLPQDLRHVAGGPIGNPTL